MVDIIHSLRITDAEKTVLQTLEVSLLNQTVPVLYRFQKRFPHQSLSPFFIMPADSERSFADWCEGFLKLTTLLEDAHRAVPLESVVKYLACCDEGGVHGVSLWAIVEEYYQDYGFSG
jgi:hypothetical protein